MAESINLFFILAARKQIGTFVRCYCRFSIARMAELVDALVSNTCVFTDMPVRLRLRVHFKSGFFNPLFL
jgi:hypothetical protein